MPQSASVRLYASVGPELMHYDVDVEGAALVRRGGVTLPANVHYAWPHTSRRFLYVASSDSEPGATAGRSGGRHHVSALSIDPGSGALQPHGAPIPLPTRPIHLTTDIPSEHILVAFSNPSGVRVYRVDSDDTPGSEVEQQQVIDPGIYAHQVRVAPDNRLAILVARGHDAQPGKPEEPGALKVFRYRDGQLEDEVSVAPEGGYGFGPRHLDFPPEKPWVYVALERQNRLDLFARAIGCRSKLCSARTHWPHRVAAAGGRSPARFMSIRTGGSSISPIAHRARSRARGSASSPAARTPWPSSLSIP